MAMHLPVARGLAIAALSACGVAACADRPVDSATPSDPAPIDPATPGHGAGGAPRHWQCGETGVASRAPGPGSVHLFVSGRHLALRVDPGASGARSPEDAHGTRFETQGDTARLTLTGEAAVDCTRASRPSPWFEAAERGVVLRAVGSEPGWLAEIRPGRPMVLHATLDYGERTLELPLDSDPPPATRAWTATTAGGVPVRLTAMPAACRDGMSGVLHEARVEFEVGDRAYTGCGAFLDDFASFMQ